MLDYLLQEVHRTESHTVGGPGLLWSFLKKRSKSCQVRGKARQFMVRDASLLLLGVPESISWGWGLGIPKNPCMGIP